MTKVVIVGAGKGGRALLEMFRDDPTVTLLGIADVNPWAPGLELARRLDIPVATDPKQLIADPRLDLIIDVTGNAEVQRSILEFKAPRAEVMGGASAKFMWDLLAERKRSGELEDRYSLMLRELQAQSEGRLHPRAEPQDEGDRRADRAGGSDADHRADPRRVRHREGAGRPRHPPLLTPARQAADHRELHRAHADPHGVRALRS
jgi:hypothetical protein